MFPKLASPSPDYFSWFADSTQGLAGFMVHRVVNSGTGFSASTGQQSYQRVTLLFSQFQYHHEPSFRSAYLQYTRLFLNPILNHSIIVRITMKRSF